MELTYQIKNHVITSTDLENNDYKLLIEKKENEIIIKIIPKKELTLLKAKSEISYKYKKNDLIYLNGYQSWTDTKEFTIKEKLHSLKHLPKFLVNKYHFKKYGDESFINYQKNILHCFTYSYVKSDNNTFLIGSYNFKNAYLIINHFPKENKIILESDINNLTINTEFTLFDYVTYEGNKDTVLKNYLIRFKCPNTKKISGYTSWYNHYQNINEKLLLNDLAGINNDSYDLFQIDDGYQSFVGDWLKINQEKFPNGLRGLVEKIHRKNLKAGIWLAPFVAEKNSFLFKEHPEFFYYENDKEVYAGCNWSGQLVLDIRKDEVKAYLKEVFKTYIELGFDLFKLDFLYAAALIKDKYKTRAKIMQESMEFLRAILPDKLILGCGVPLANAFSNVNYCRIGPDVSLIFDDVFFMRMMHRERISTKVTIQNTIYRSHLNNYVFLNDPDVYLLRDNNIRLSFAQRKALILINHLCGSVYFTSDNVANYDKEKLLLLEQARKLSDAKILDVKTIKKLIIITYQINDKTYQLKYNTKKGVIING